MASGYHYHSDDSDFDDVRKPRNRTSASDTGHSRSARYGRRRRHSSTAHSDERHSAASAVGKIALGVIFVQVVSTCFSMWMSKKDEAKYHVREQEDRRREFEKAKAKRRRDEERYEREEEDRERKEASRWEREEIITEGRRIGFVESPEIDSEEEERIAPRQIEAKPEWDRRDDRDISMGDRARTKSTDGRSMRSAGAKSTAGRREAARAGRHQGRSRSRPPVDDD